MSGYLIFGGIDSRDYDVFVSFSDIDTVPRRVYTKVDIVGKNGAVLIDEGKYEDVPHSYDCIVLDNEKRVAFVNAIMSKKGYQRLTDSYGTDEYYTAVLEENIEQNTTRIRDKYKFKLVFTRKPQRFLTSGEEPVDTSELGGEVTTDKIPYLLRRSGGGNIGHDFDAEIDKIIGGTVAWNQLVKNGDFSNGDQYVSVVRATKSVSNNVLTVTATDTSPLVYIMPGSNVPQGHKVLVVWDFKLTANTTRTQFAIRTDVTNVATTNDISFTANQRTKYAWIGDISSDITNFRVDMYIDRAGTAGADIYSVMAIDLTALFGSAEIADYVYSLEQTTAGAGVAWLKSHGFIDGSYRAYDSGSLQSVKTSEHRTVGFNQWDEEWEVGSIDVGNGQNVADSTCIRSKNYIPVLPNETYFLMCGVQSTFNYRFYDANKSYIRGTYSGRNNTLAIPSNVAYLRFTIGSAYGTTYNHDICINLSDPSKNGQYEPYESHSYPLDSDLELRGIPKLSNGSLYYDGDVYESSGAVTRKYKLITFDGSSDETWSANATYQGLYYTASPTDCRIAQTPLCNRFLGLANQAASAISKKVGCMAMSGGLGALNFMTSYSSLKDFRTWLASNPVQVLLQLETPTTETAEPYASPQVVNPLGTEEYIDTRNVPVPVGHETKYGMSQLILSNPTEFPSKPLLEVTGVGTFWLGDTLFTIMGTAGQTIYIDCETGEAWKNTGGVITPANGLVTLNRLDFPELDPGDTPVMYGTGITKVVVTPRWWRL